MDKQFAITADPDMTLETWVTWSKHNLVYQLHTTLKELNLWEILLAGAAEVGPKLDGFILMKRKADGVLGLCYFPYWYDGTAFKPQEFKDVESLRKVIERHQNEVSKGMLYWHSDKIDKVLNELSSVEREGTPVS